MKSPVLIVDDDQDIRRLAAMTLRRSGYEVLQAETGDACLNLLREGFGGVILMDICMPGRTGWETIQVAAKEGLLVRSLVCMMTGERAPGSEGESVLELVFDYLPKPFPSSSLTEMVNNAATHLMPG